MKTVRDNVRGSRFRVPIAIGLGVGLVLLLSANGLASTYTDWLWFTNVGFASIWTKILLTQFALGAVFTLVFFLILWGNLVLADRLAPDFRPASPEEDLIERYHQIVGRRAGMLRIGVAALFALIAGANTATSWQQWLLFSNGGSFGRVDPIFGRDTGFYVFRLPFFTFIVDWLFAALILTIIVVAVAHYLNGGIRAATNVDRVTSGVKLHLSILLAALALVRAAGYWFDRFGLLTSSRGRFDGALATDVNVQLPAYNLLALISLFGAALFVANIRRQGWGLPMVAIGLWGISHLFVGSVFPALYQRLIIEPQRSTREADFVLDNILATRFAYGLDETKLTTEEFAYAPGLTADEAEDYGNVFDSVPLVDPELAIESFTRSQGERAFYRFSDPVDVDRYQIDGELRPVVLSMRGLNLDADEVGNDWESQHIFFTHGYGAAMAAGWEVDESGRPRFLVEKLGEVQINEDLTETLGQPRVYFGEDFGGYAIINAERDEVDFQTSSNESVANRYDGTGGVKMGSVLRRTAFALRFRDLDPLIAASVTGESRALYNRDVAGRVRTVAPFLRFDSNPYPVLAEDQLFWVIDGYTTSNDYPYSQRVETTLVGSELAGGYNYVRNSVKAVVDAYNGDVKLYIIDESDPVVEAWSKAFPDLFSSQESVPASINDNFRYPEDIFRVQTDMWSRYVVSDPVQLVQGDVAWSVAAKPRGEAQTVEDEPISNTSMDPQYLITRLPGETESEFVLQRAFVPISGEAGSSTARPELTGIMMARSDPDHYGELMLYEIDSGIAQAPDFVHSEIRKDDEVTNFVLEKSSGSLVTFGEMTMLLVDDTIVYIRPLYVEAPSRTAVPELSRVIAVNGDRIAMAETLDGALADIVDGATEDEPESIAAGTPEDVEEADDPPEDRPDDQPATDYDPTGKSVVRLISEADEFLREANVAEETGNDAQAIELRQRAQIALNAAGALLGGELLPLPTDQTSGT